MPSFDGGRFMGPVGDIDPMQSGPFAGRFMGKDYSSAVRPSQSISDKSWAGLTPAQQQQYADALARTNVAPSSLRTAVDNYNSLFGSVPASLAMTPTTKVKDLPRDIVADVLTAPPNTAINMAPPTMAPPSMVNSYAPTAAPSAAAAAIGGQMAAGHPGVSYNGPAAPTSGPNAGGNFGLTDLPSLNSMMSPKANIGGILSNMAGPIGGLLGALGMERAGTPAGGYGGILGGLLGRTNSGDGMGGGGPGGRDGGGKSGGSSSRGGGYGGGTNSNGAGRRN